VYKIAASGAQYQQTALKGNSQPELEMHWLLEFRT